MFKPMEGARVTFTDAPARFTSLQIIRLDGERSGRWSSALGMCAILVVLDPLQN